MRLLSHLSLELPGTILSIGRESLLRMKPKKGVGWKVTNKSWWHCMSLWILLFLKATLFSRLFSYMIEKKAMYVKFCNSLKYNNQKEGWPKNLFRFKKPKWTFWPTQYIYAPVPNVARYLVGETFILKLLRYSLKVASNFLCL